MTIALSEYWTNLVRAGIVAAEDCKSIASACSNANRGRVVADPVLIAKFMIKAGTLTEFQASSLLSSPPRPIRFGGFVQRSESTARPLSQWMDVQAIDDRSRGWLLRLPNGDVDQRNRQWLADHQRVNDERLQPIQCSASSPETIELFSKLHDGQCLFDVLHSKDSIDSRRAVEIAIELSKSLEVLHQEGLVHGGVRADRVWLDDRGKTVLLREPIRWSLKPKASDSLGVISEGPSLDDLESAAAYAAPELAQPTFSHDPLTDIYSLGCLLFRMITGRMPFESQTPEVLMAAHAHETPPEITEAVSQGAAGDPCFRIIAFAMAKNREARFGSATQFFNALQAVLPLLGNATPKPEDGDSKIVATDKKPAGRKPSPAQNSERKQPNSRPTAIVGSEKRSAPGQSSKKKKPKPTAVEPVRSSIKESSETDAPKTAHPPVVTETKAPKSKRNVGFDSKTEPPNRPPPTAPAPAKSLAPKADAPVMKEPPVPPKSQADSTSPETPLPVPPPVDSSTTVSTPQAASSTPPEGERTKRRRRKKKNSVAPLALGGLGIVALLLVVALLVYDPKPPEKKTANWRPAPTVIPSVGGGGATELTKSPAASGSTISSNRANSPSSTGRYELIDDDRFLFAPPDRHGDEKATLDLLPPGPGIVFSARLASIQESAFGHSVKTIMGRDFDRLLGILEARSGVSVGEIDRCTVAFHKGEAGWPDTSLAIDLVRPMPLKDLLDRWKASMTKTPEGATIYTGDEADADAYFVGGGEAGKIAAGSNVSRFSVGTVSRVREVAELDGAEIPLPQAMDKLWRTSSRNADLFALVTPNFLLADSRSMLEAVSPQLGGSLKSFLIPDVSATQFMATVDDDRTYLELRLVPSGDLSDAGLRERFQSHIESWPKWADDFIVDAVPDASWRLLANRLPAMMRFLVDHTREGLADSAVVANAYLPSSGATQLSLATLLALNTPRDAGSSVTTGEKMAESLSLNQMLDRKMSVAFEQESLEFAINTIVDEFQRSLPKGSQLPPVRIVGGDLQLMGITQNQQIRDFSKSELPLRQVLTELVMGANPDKTATGPKDPKQALIWVVVDQGGAEGQTEILVTTRLAAEGKYEIPPEFVAP